jgi:tetratricopeptide (TPR) repeat protein
MNVAAGPEAAARLAGLEETYKGHAVVQRDLGRRHLADGRPRDAVRCLERWIELSPDGQASFDLADAYRAGGDEDGWRKTLEASLEREDVGLDHARVRVALAEWHMARGEYDKAEPYAMAAAETYAGWALLCAARCKEGLEKWDEAEKIYRAAAERYDNAALHWYFASRRNGKLDPAAAEKAAREYVAGLRGGVPPDDALAVGRYHLMNGRTKEARELIFRATQGETHTYLILFNAFLSDASQAIRDGILWRAVASNVGSADEKAVAGTIRTWMAQPGPPDAATVEGALAGRPPGVKADAEFFVGWLLASRGETERARAHWERCVAAKEGTRWLKTHARAFLDGGKP